MRRAFLILPFLIACGGAEQAQTDTAAMAPAPAMLTEADVAGTWTGVSMPEGSDSVVARWTQICAAGTCKGVIEGQTDTVMSTYRIEGDSSIGTSSAFADPMVQGRMVVDTWVARISGGQVTGTLVTRLADNPDSVVMRSRFTGSRAP
jgi:hypothetical protein